MQMRVNCYSISTDTVVFRDHGDVAQSVDGGGQLLTLAPGNCATQTANNEIASTNYNIFEIKASFFGPGNGADNYTGGVDLELQGCTAYYAFLGELLPLFVPSLSCAPGSWEWSGCANRSTKIRVLPAVPVKVAPGSIA